MWFYFEYKYEKFIIDGRYVTNNYFTSIYAINDISRMLFICVLINVLVTFPSVNFFSLWLFWIINCCYYYLFVYVAIVAIYVYINIIFYYVCTCRYSSIIYYSRCLRIGGYCIFIIVYSFFFEKINYYLAWLVVYWYICTYR